MVLTAALDDVAGWEVTTTGVEVVVEVVAAVEVGAAGGGEESTWDSGWVAQPAIKLIAPQMRDARVKWRPWAGWIVFIPNPRTAKTANGSLS
jgi:hypothetical protein